MKKLIITALLSLTATAWAQAIVQVDGAWVRGTVASQKASGAFMKLTASAPVRLVAAQASVAGVVEIHQMEMDKDVMKMREVPAIELPAGRTVELKPGGLHVMLMDLKQPLKAGDMVALTLVFEDAAKQRFTQAVTAPVTALGAGAPAPMPHGHGHGHKH
ncbi:MAG: copper chaperone PCu(A)C [Hydrogenophaga sp.]|jgi:copper(I)-binding protein|nr:copper chaperone PCu(A)C [Hydrogenophaga sp.]